MLQRPPLQRRCAECIIRSNNDALEDKLHGGTAVELELATWTKKGPIGKLHNIVYWINRSPQCCERFDALQRRLIVPKRPDGKRETYELVRDVETR